MVQIPLRRAHRLRAIILASPTKKLRPQPTERTPTAWHTNDEYTNAEASEEASASSAVANVSEKRILPIPTPRHWLHQSCSYKHVSSAGPFYAGLRAARYFKKGDGFRALCQLLVEYQFFGQPNVAAICALMSADKLILFFPPCCCEPAMLEEGVSDHRHKRMSVSL